MANPSIRGHKGFFQVFKNGTLQGNIIDITSVDVSQDSTFQRSFYVGRATPEADQSIEGWSGSIELEVKDAAVDEFIDALVTDNLNGIGVADYAFVVREEYGDGTAKSYVYTDCVWKMSRRQAGLTEKITKRLEFQSSFRQPL